MDEAEAIVHEAGYRGWQASVRIIAVSTVLSIHELTFGSRLALIELALDPEFTVQWHSFVDQQAAAWNALLPSLGLV